MDSASFQFVFFGVVVVVLSNLGRSPAWRSLVLFTASVAFLALLAGNVLALAPLLGFLLLGFAGIILVRRGWVARISGLALLIVFAYIWLKAYTFLPAGILLRFPYFTLGLSYIFFRVMHLLVEAPAAEERDAPALWQYVLYTLNFTTLVCGPIQRYEDFAAEQFAPQPRGLDIQTVGLQVERILRGLFKVNVLAMLLHAYHTDALLQLTMPSSTGLRLFDLSKIIILYPLFLYCNFSGYVDIVIALARLMRLELPENFDRPFSATSVMEFWNSWHITLSTWFKTYVFNPMLFALMRHIPSAEREPFLGVLCFFITFFLVGIWHGRTAEYVMFGVLTGAGISANALWQVIMTKWLGRKTYRQLAGHPTYNALGRGLTFSWFGFTLFWFWSDWPQIRSCASAASTGQWAALCFVIWIVMSAVLGLWEWLRARLLAFRSPDGPILTNRYALTIYSSAIVFITVVITVLLNQPAPGIVYKAF